MSPASCGVRHRSGTGSTRRSGMSGTLVDPARPAERLVGAEVVRLPERARVGRDREAADLDLVAHDPRRERRRPAPARRQPRPSPARRQSRYAGEGERQRRRAACSRGSRSPVTTPSPAERRASVGRCEERQAEHRRAEQLVEDLAVAVDVVPDEVRAAASRRPRRSAPRAARGGGGRSRRRRAPSRRRRASARSRATTSGARRSSRSAIRNQP